MKWASKVGKMRESQSHSLAREQRLGGYGGKTRWRTKTGEEAGVLILLRSWNGKGGMATEREGKVGDRDNRNKEKVTTQRE